MTITDTQITPSTNIPTGAGAAVAGDVKPVRRRISLQRGLLAAGLIVLAVLVSVFAFSSVSKSTPVFVAKSDIVRGHVITKDDLTTISISADQDTSAVSATKADTLIGQIAAVDIPQGGLVTKSSVTSSLSVPAGKALVGITLQPGKYPAQTLHAGDNVVLVPAQAQGAPPASIGADQTTPAVISQVRPVPNTNDVVVDVYVSSSNAPSIASRGASGGLALYLASGASK